jgi:hypothetical protein
LRTQVPFQTKSFSKKRYGSLEAAYLAATTKRLALALEYGTRKNVWHVALHPTLAIECLHVEVGHGRIMFAPLSAKDLVDRYVWTSDGNHGCTFYVKKAQTLLEARISFHQKLMEPPDGMVIDHIDGNGLNNVYENLRIVTPRENNQNHLIPITNTSGVCGVQWHNVKRTWGAYWPKATPPCNIRPKVFSARKYGYAEAFAMACDVRRRAEIALGITVRKRPAPETRDAEDDDAAPAAKKPRIEQDDNLM